MAPYLDVQRSECPAPWDIATFIHVVKDPRQKDGGRVLGSHTPPAPTPKPLIFPEQGVRIPGLMQSLSRSKADCHGWYEEHPQRALSGWEGVLGAHAQGCPASQWFLDMWPQSLLPGEVRAASGTPNCLRLASGCHFLSTKLLVLLFALVLQCTSFHLSSRNGASSRLHFAALPFLSGACCHTFADLLNYASPLGFCVELGCALLCLLCTQVFLLQFPFPQSLLSVSTAPVVALQSSTTDCFYSLPPSNMLGGPL